MFEQSGSTEEKICIGMLFEQTYFFPAYEAFTFIKVIQILQQRRTIHTHSRQIVWLLLNPALNVLTDSYELRLQISKVKCTLYGY